MLLTHYSPDLSNACLEAPCHEGYGDVEVGRKHYYPFHWFVLKRYIGQL